jgi:hypothetical protein
LVRNEPVMLKIDGWAETVMQQKKENMEKLQAATGGSKG